MKHIGFTYKNFSNPTSRMLLEVLVAAILVVYSAIISDDCCGLINTQIYPKLRIDFVNLGQSDGTLIRTPKGKVILVDGGSNISEEDAKVEKRELIVNYLKKANINHIDAVIVTHWHIDNFSGLIPVLEEFKVNCIFETAVGIKSDIYQIFDELATQRRIKRISIKAGSKLELGDEVFIQALNPEELIPTEKGNEVNDNSLAIMVGYGKVRTLLCGDIGISAQGEMLKYGESLKCQIVKIPNHGAKENIYLPFFQKLTADYAVLSLGKDNLFGFPSFECLEMVANLDLKVYRTDYNGNIKLEIGGKDEKDYSFSVDRNL